MCVWHLLQLLYASDVYSAMVNNYCYTQYTSSSSNANSFQQLLYAAIFETRSVSEAIFTHHNCYTQQHQLIPTTVRRRYHRLLYAEAVAAASPNHHFHKLLYTTFHSRKHSHMHCIDNTKATKKIETSNRNRSRRNRKKNEAKQRCHLTVAQRRQLPPK